MAKAMAKVVAKVGKRKELSRGLLVLAGGLVLTGCGQPAVQAPEPVPEQAASPSTAETPVITPTNWPLQQPPIARTQAIEDKIKALLAQMSPEQKVGQIIQADIASVTPKQVRDYYLGSVLNGGNSALTIQVTYSFASPDTPATYVHRHRG